MIKAASLFSNVGIAETYLHKHDISVVVANELLKERADFYKHLYPTANMIVGDITTEAVFESVVAAAIEENIDFLIATPPCQGMSVAGKMDENDPRNSLIIRVVEFVKRTQPTNIIIENVPTMLKTYIVVNNEKVLIKDYINRELGSIYNISFNVLNAADYGTAQVRKRAIVLLTKHKEWQLPDRQPLITVKDVIGDLPSLESNQRSNIKYHYAPKHNDNHILWMKHTATGKTAFDNAIYFPQKEDGTRIKGFATTYKRIDWDKPAPTVTMCNGAISSQNNVHPGRKLPDGTYSDARVLTILELLRITGLPDDWDIPTWATDNLVRKVIGEGIPPHLIEALVSTMPK